MQPERAARFLATVGSFLLLIVLALRGFSIGAISDSQQLPGLISEEDLLIPAQGLFTFSEDGNEVYFQQGLADLQSATLTGEDGLEWYAMRLEGGPIRPASPPEVDIRPFMVRGGRLFLLVGEGYSLATGSPLGTTVVETALSPRRDAMAFVAYRPGGQWGLYVLTDMGRLVWLGEEDSISSLAWSPDAEYIAFAAPREHIDQVIVAQSEGSSFQQLTFDASRKGSVAWSGDGRWIAYTATSGPVAGNIGQATPTPEPVITAPKSAEDEQVDVDIFLLDAEAALQDSSAPPEPRRLTETREHEYNLAWVGGGNFLAYAVRTSSMPNVAHLFLADPSDGSLRRAFPPLGFDRLECPARIRRGEMSDVTFTLTNSSQHTLSAPIILRSADARLPLLGDRRASAARIETVDLQPGETRQITWQAPASRGLVTYISALIDIGQHFPMDEEHCSAPNTYMGLPNLPFLSIMLPMTVFGMLLCIPWLRHQKKRLLWILWLAAPIVLVILVAVEASMARKIV